MKHRHKTICITLRNWAVSFPLSQRFFIYPHNIIFYLRLSFFLFPHYKQDERFSTMQLYLMTLLTTVGRMFGYHSRNTRKLGTFTPCYKWASGIATTWHRYSLLAYNKARFWCYISQAEKWGHLICEYLWTVMVIWLGISSLRSN